MPAQAGGGVKVALAEGGPATATAAMRQDDFKSGGLQHRHGRDANVWLVVAHEGVVPEDDAAAGGMCRAGLPGEPVIEALRGVRREGALRGESEGFFERGAQPGPTQRGVGEGGHQAAQAPQRVNRTDQALPPGEAVALVAGVQQPGLEQGEIDVGRAFLRAGLAGKAVAERGFQFRRAQRIADAAQFQRGANGVGASPGGHDFLAGGDEGGAHGRGVFAATAAAVALFQVADEGAVLGRESQDGRERELQRRAGQAEAGVNMIAAVGNDLAGIEGVPGIEGGFDVAGELHQFRAEVVGNKFGAGDADTMFGGERTVELPDKAGNLDAKLAQFFAVGFQVQIQHRADVEQTGSGMAVKGAAHAQGLEKGLEAGHVGGQIGGTHGGILDAGDWFGRPRATGEEGQAGLAQRPDQIELRRVLPQSRAKAEAFLGEQSQTLGDVFIEEFNDQDGFAGLGIEAEEVARGLKLQLTSRLIEEQAVNVFDGGGLQFKKFDGGLHGVGDRGEKNQAQAPGFGQRNDLQFRGSYGGQSAFAAGQKMTQILRVAQETFQAIARTAFQQAGGKVFVNGGGVRANQLGKKILKVAVASRH